eukprot:scaffold1064_cov85-Amphora_coffeaeformis.AAC.24
MQLVENNDYLQSLKFSMREWATTNTFGAFYTTLRMKKTLRSLSLEEDLRFDAALGDVLANHTCSLEELSLRNPVQCL